MRTRGRLYTIAIGLTLILLAACSSGGGKHAPEPSEPGAAAKLVSTPPALVALEHETSCDAFKSYVSDSISDLILHIGVVACPSCVVTVAGGTELTAAADTDAASFEAFTGTNNQEQGVDELDQLEADAAGRLYFIDGRHLVVADGLPPAELHEIASLELEQSGYLDGLLLDPENQRLVVVASDFSFFVQGPSILPPHKPITELLFVDVADPANPFVDRRLSIEGFKLAVRRVGNRIHVVAHTTPAIPASIYGNEQLLDLRQRLADAIANGDSDAQASLTREIRDLVDALVAATDAGDYLPEITLHVGDEETDVASPICADVAVPDVTMPLALTSVTSMDTDGTNVAALKLANNSWNVYASEQNLYLTQTSGGWWFADLQHQQTAIYKVGIGAGAPVYRALGVVDGWVGSSFQLSEHAGYLRVATNRREYDPEAAVWLWDNNLYVLRDDDAGALDIVGSVLGFGASETIFSTRFLGDRGFVVTFRQVDPVFAFDLSIPSDPRLVGAIEIPGVSTYIHPLDDNHLLTIGYDGDETRLNGDFRLQILDVQNLDDPRLVHSFVPFFDADGFAWTQATFDHLAFNYFAEAGTLTVPVQYFASNQSEHFSGFIAFSVDTATGFAELGRLDHSDLARETYCVEPGTLAPAICGGGVYLEAATPRRAVSALVGDTAFIYTLSNVGMKVSPAVDFANAVAVLPLPYPNEYPWLVTL